MFAQDLLLIDTELTHPDATKGAIVELSALLLDKKNFLEKKQWSAFVRPSLFEIPLESLARNLSISKETLKSAKRLPEVLKEFIECFTTDSFQTATFGLQSFLALDIGFKKAGVKSPLALPIFDAWTAIYTTQNRHFTKLPGLETFAEEYKLRLSNPHSSLERVKLTAEILRKVLV